MEIRVRPGRECKFCGESLLAAMVPSKASIDGHSMRCKKCNTRIGQENRAQWVAANPEAARERNARSNAGRERTDETRAVQRAATARWRANNSERMLENDRVKAARRRSRLAAAPCVGATLAEVRGLSRICPCTAPADQLDHIVPVAKGGCANLHNLQFLCVDCNQRKHDRMPEPGTGCPVVNPG